MPAVKALFGAHWKITAIAQVFFVCFKGIQPATLYCIAYRWVQCFMVTRKDGSNVICSIYVFLLPHLLVVSLVLSFDRGVCPDSSEHSRHGVCPSAPLCHGSWGRFGHCGEKDDKIRTYNLKKKCCARVMSRGEL